MATFEERKASIKKIFEYEPSRSSFENRTISATTDEELTQIVTDYISDSTSIITFDDKKTFHLNYCALKRACEPEVDKVVVCGNDTEMAQIMADNYQWFFKIKE